MFKMSFVLVYFETMFFSFDNKNVERQKQGEKERDGQPHFDVSKKIIIFVSFLTFRYCLRCCFSTILIVFTLHTQMHIKMKTI